MIDPDLIKVSKFVFVVIMNKTNIIPIFYYWNNILKFNVIVLNIQLPISQFNNADK